MDTELLKTFLEVRRTRHFGRAADHLFVTQAAVSARIRQLERLLGQQLFVRDRKEIRLTPAGHRLVPYAESMLATWQRARMATAEGDEPLLVVGSLPSLREIYLDAWLPVLLAQTPAWRLQVESLTTPEIVERIRNGALDLGLLYEPPAAADLWSEAITRFELVLVSTQPDQALAAALERYVEVDWGASAAATLSELAFPPAAAWLRLDSAELARRVLLACGGSAFLAAPAIAADLDAGVLHPIADAPLISRPVYLIGHHRARASSPRERFVEMLRERLS